MAKKRGSGKTYRPGERGTFDSPRSRSARPPRWDLLEQNLGLHVTRRRVGTLPLLPREPLLEVEDLRQWHPAPDLEPARTRSGRPAGIQATPLRPRSRSSHRGLSPSLHWPSFGVEFKAPWKVLVCVRRKVRREVLHALRWTGKGTGGGRHRRNLWSQVRCR